jgi:hypothetical protein
MMELLLVVVLVGCRGSHLNELPSIAIRSI